MLEEAWTSVIQGQGGPLRALLRVASWGYGAGVSFRNRLYDLRLLPTYPSPLPTISVGNLLLGGSGKTPLIRYLAKTHTEKVAILTRGYKSQAEKRSTPTLVTSDADWQEVGDEPLMLAKTLPDTSVIVSADRVKGAAFAKELGAELLLLDDGFQHRRLSRDQNIVCIPATTPLSLFPRGPLREPLSSLKRATLVAITECEQVIPQSLAQTLQRYTSAPVVPFTSTFKAMNGAGKELDIKGKKVAIYCGIARPERFRQTVEKLGGEVVREVFLPDHGTLSKKQLNSLQDTDAELILCTEKDWVKGSLADGYVCLEAAPAWPCLSRRIPTLPIPTPR